MVHLVEALDSSDLAAVAELCAGDGERIGDGVYLNKAMRCTLPCRPGSSR